MASGERFCFRWHWQPMARYLAPPVFLLFLLLSWHVGKIGITFLPRDDRNNATRFYPPSFKDASIEGPDVQVLNGLQEQPARSLPFVPPPDTHIGDQLPPCTLDFILKYAQRTGFVPDAGVWEGGDFPQFPHMKYHPKACSLPDPIVDFRKLNHFVGSTQAKRFVIIGSSQAHHYKEEFMEHLLQFETYKCERIRTEDGGAYKHNYYVSNLTKEEDIISKGPNCNSCKASLDVCTPASASGTHAVVNIETLVAFNLLITGFKTLRDPTRRRDCLSSRLSPSQCYRSNNINEFYFKEYLRAYPTDVVLWFLPLSHEIEGTRDPLVFTKVVQTFLNQVDKSMDNRTKIMWFPCHSHDQSKKPPPYNKMSYRGKTATQYIDMYNRIFVKALQPYLARARRQHYLFLDLVSMSKPRLGDWSKDGVHMTKWWYRYVTAYAWHVMINSPEEWSTPGNGIS